MGAEELPKWDEIKDPEGNDCFEYLQFDIPKFSDGVIILRESLFNGLEAIESSDVERAKEEHAYRIEKAANDLDIELRKLRPRYPLCRSEDYAHRCNQLKSNSQKYSRHMKRCNLMILTLT